MEIGPLDHLEEDLGVPGDRGCRYEVVAKFIIEARDPEEAEQFLNDVIQEGQLKLLEDEDREPIYEYNIDDVTPAAI